MKNLAGKTAVITGAASGLGKALAICLFNEGCSLALIDVDNAGLKSLYKTLLHGTQNISIHTTDISSEENVKQVCHAITSIHATVNILINNAAISISQAFEQLDLRDYHRLIDVNFWGTVYCTRHFLPLLKQGQSSLVNIISDFALMGFPGKTAYGSSKAAVMAFTYSLKTELAGTPVRVSLVIPPPMNTNIVKQGKHVSEEKRQNEMLFLERHGMPVELAAKKIITKVKRGKFRIVVGGMMWCIDAMSRLFPTLSHRLIAGKKDSFDFF